VDYTCDECSWKAEFGSEEYDIIDWIDDEPYCPECGHRLSGY